MRRPGAQRSPPTTSWRPWPAPTARTGATAGFFGDVESDGQDPVDPAERAGLVPRAENIAFGQADAAAVMEAWLKSPGHRANILDCDLTLLGTGVATGTGGPWWTQLFA